MVLVICHSDAMKNKRCFKCQCLKPLDEFHRNQHMADGRINQCKECVKTYYKEYREKNHEHLMEYNRRYYQDSPENRAVNIAKSREWAKNNPTKTAAATRGWKKRNQDKIHCHNVINNAIRDGKIAKPDACSSCGKSGVKIHGHHPDYTKPLDVMWLCATCHSRQHRLEREQLRQREPRIERA